MLFLANRVQGYALLRAAGLPEAALSPFWLLGGFLDLGLGIGCYSRAGLVVVASIMLAVTTFYLFALSLAVPALWAAPLGALPESLMVMLLTL